MGIRSFRSSSSRTAFNDAWLNACFARADVVVWDPLRDFSLDDLNSDKFMGETLRDILRLTKRGNPKRFPLAIHHAATGRAGVQKTTGWDRSSFGRNSKVLQMTARAVINVAPAKGEDNSTIIIASGKSNNAPEFSPFAAKLNFETMLYAPDEDFDLEGWKEEIGTGREARVTPKDFRELLKRGQEYEKRQLVKILDEEKGVGKTYAYRMIDEAKSRGGPATKQGDQDLCPPIGLTPRKFHHFSTSGKSVENRWNFHFPPTLQGWKWKNSSTKRRGNISKKARCPQFAFLRLRLARGS